MANDFNGFKEVSELIPLLSNDSNEEEKNLQRDKPSKYFLLNFFKVHIEGIFLCDEWSFFHFTNFDLKQKGEH